MAGAVPFLIESNTISGNGDAGIWVRLQNSSTAGLQILSNSIVNQINGPSPLAGGEGIHFRTEGTSFLWDADIENNFIGIASNGSAGPNISNGIEFETFGNSRIGQHGPLSRPLPGQNHQQHHRVQRRRRHQLPAQRRLARGTTC